MNAFDVEIQCSDDDRIIISDGAKSFDTVPVQFTLILNVKMKSAANNYVTSLTNSKKTLVVGVRFGPKIFIDYRNGDGLLKTMPFDLQVTTKSGVQVVLSVRQDDIYLSVDCYQYVLKPKPNDFPKDIESNGMISVGKREFNEVTSVLLVSCEQFLCNGAKQ